MMHYLQYHNTQENKGVNWEGTKAAGEGGGRQISSVSILQERVYSPRQKAPGGKACIGPTGEMMHNGRVRIAVPRAPQACTTEIKRIP